MSASPTKPTPGGTPDGNLQPVMRRHKQADPLVRPRDRKRRPHRPVASNEIFRSQVNGSTAPGQLGIQKASRHQSKPSQQDRPLYFSPKGHNEPVSGFSSAPVAQYIDYPLVTTKKSLMEGMRHHVARFASKKNVDPRDEHSFVRPVRLHRRDPRAPAFGGGASKDENGELRGVDELDDKERERQDILKAERDAQREAELAKVAPVANSWGQKKPNAFDKKKTRQIFRNDPTDEQKAKTKLRYEEALPWHLEDFEGKQVWVGNYEAALSDTYAMFIHGPDGKFRIVPLEKWYKFTPKNQFKTLTIEEAETRMNKKVKDPRWFMDSQQATKERQDEQDNKKATRGLFLGKWERGAGSSGSAAPRIKTEQADADDLDFEEDRFADDEENVLFEGELEETKQAEDRIKRDQLQANIFDLKEEKEYDKAELEEKREKDAEKKLGKGVKKALMKREKNYIYDSDSADNPYSEESESDSTETERLKEEERKKAEERKPQGSDTEKGKPHLSKHSSGASSKGTNTPSNRASKHHNPMKKQLSPTSSHSLKRSGSPNLSEASGTETSRKKHKKQHPPVTSSLSQPSNPPSQLNSPPFAIPSSSAPELTRSSQNAPNSRKPSAVRPSADVLKATDTSASNRSRSQTGYGSEVSGGEMSDGTRAKLKLKFRAGSKTASASASRAGSPDIKPSIDTTAKAANPPTTTTAPSQAPPPPPSSSQSQLQPSSASSDPFPTAAELRARVPPSGIKVGDLLAFFKGQVHGPERKDRFAKLMRENSRYDKVNKLLKPLED